MHTILPTNKLQPFQLLIGQQKPESDKSPFFELERKFGVQLTFAPFIKIEAFSSKEFRKQKIDLTKFSGVILTTKNAVDYYFKTLEEQKIPISVETKYYCSTESIGLYLQKFIEYRKRKIFFGVDGTNKSLFEIIIKHKAPNYLYVCSENQQDSSILQWLKEQQFDYQLAFMYRSVSCDLKEVFNQKHFDMICIFTPSGLKSLQDNFPNFVQNDLLIGAYGENTIRAVEEAGLRIDLKAPKPKALTMAAAIDQFFTAAQVGVQA